MSWSIYATGLKAPVVDLIKSHKVHHLENQPEEKASYEAAKALAISEIECSPCAAVKVEMCGSRCSGPGTSPASNLQVLVQGVYLLGLE